MSTKEKYVITLECRAADYYDVNDYLTSLLYGPHNGSGFAEEFDVIIDNIYIDREDY